MTPMYLAGDFSNGGSRSRSTIWPRVIAATYVWLEIAAWAVRSVEGTA
jgi:hypothetical protein